MNVELRPMRPGDVPEMLQIERVVFPTPWTEGMFRQEIEGAVDSRSVVADAGGRVVGYAIAWFVDVEVHLVNIAVAPEYQGKGIGTRLVTHIIEAALEAGKLVVTLEVRASNAPAQSFYRGFFFQTIGVRRRYYSDTGEDALLMALSLDAYRRRRGSATV